MFQCLRRSTNSINLRGEEAEGLKDYDDELWTSSHSTSISGSVTCFRAVFAFKFIHICICNRCSECLLKSHFAVRKIESWAYAACTR